MPTSLTSPRKITFDTSKVSAMQDAYLCCLSDKAWGDLYIALGEIVKPISSIYLRGIGVSLPIEAVEDLRSGVTLKIMERYRSPKGYQVTYWYEVVTLAIKWALHNPKSVETDKVIRYDSEQALDVMYHPGETDDESIVDEAEYLRIKRDIEDTHLPRKSNTVLQRHYDREFRAVVEKLIEYTSATIICRYRRQIRELFDNSRRYTLE